MASKANVTSIFLLLLCTVSSGHLVKRALPIRNDLKRYPSPSSSRKSLNFTETCDLYGYSSEEHTIVTEDGYILTAFRMFKKECVLKRPPVLLMHGLLESADSWLDAGPTAGLPYLLADNCFDVWVGNQRGNYYARRHKTLNPDNNAAFWDFSAEESGVYDLPATIDYVLKHSKVLKLNYIGFSQGAAIFFIMCSERPRYCDKVNVNIGLGPVSRLTHMRSITFQIFASSLMRFQDMLSSAGYNEVLARGAFGQEFLSFLCNLTLNSEKLCGRAAWLLDSVHPGSITNETLNVMFSHFPAGTSLKVFVRYAQSLKSSKFQKYDYGESNFKVYGTKHPPSFNFSAVSVPNVIFHAKNDYLVDTKDVLWLVKRLPNVLESIEIKDPLWNHFDYICSRHISKIIYPEISKYLLMYSEVKIILKIY